MISKHHRAYGGMVIMLAAFGWLVFGTPKTVSAGEMPNPGNFTPGSSVRLEVVAPGHGGLTAPNSYVKVYSKQSNPVINILDVSDCGAVYRFQATNSSETPIANTPYGNLCYSSVSQTLSGSSMSTIGTEKWYVWVFQAEATGDLTSFKLTSANASFGFIGETTTSGVTNSSRKFAMQNWPPGGTSSENTINFSMDFGTRCGVPSGTVKQLQWFDDDQNTGDNQNYDAGDPIDAQVDKSYLNMMFRVRDETANQWVTFSGSKEADKTWFRPENGNNNDGQASMTFQKDHKYKWIWYNVADTNGIQFQLPYDSFFYNVTCNDPPKVVLDPDCDAGKLKFRVSDADNEKYDARLRIDQVDVPGTGGLKQNLTPGNNPGVNVYEFDISSYRDFTTHKISLRVVSDEGTVVEDDPIETFGPCAKLTCDGDPIVSPSNPAPGETITLTQVLSSNMGSKGTQGALYNARVVSTGTATITSLDATPGAFTQPAPTTVVGPNSGSNTVGPVIGGGVGSENYENINWSMTYPATGTYNGWVAITGSTTVNCPFNSSGIKVASKPYTRVWRGDVAAGCVETGTGPWFPTSTSGPGKILTWNLGDGKGSGTDFAAQALAGIDQFSTQQNSNMGIQDKRMTLANINAGNWGGSFAKSQCAADHEFPAASGGSISSVSLDSAESTVTYSGGTINTSTISNGRHLTVYVNGDVTIAGAGVGYNTTGWTKPSDIPSLTLIVRGDIKIASSVSSLSGTYIAMPSTNGATGGTIYTCSNGNNTVSELLGACQNQLTVYGSFVARTIKFLRLSGSVGTANQGDNYASGTAAERFVYSPELWLSSPSNTANSGYDSIMSLPPVF